MNDENKAMFTDAKGDSWHIAITFGDIMRVKKHVKGADGKPLDLCYIAEIGDFKQVTDHIEVIVQCVYWLLQPSICEYTGLNGLAAMEDFYSRIDANTIPNLMKAWYEAIINFTPYPVVKAAMMAAGETRTKSELMMAIEILAGRLVEYTSSEESAELTPGDSAMVNSARWLKPV